jgi:hypothetical protein
LPDTLLKFPPLMWVPWRAKGIPIVVEERDKGARRRKGGASGAMHRKRQYSFHFGPGENAAAVAHLTRRFQLSVGILYLLNFAILRSKW